MITTERILVVWTNYPKPGREKFKDRWMLYSTLEEAQALYNRLIKLDTTYVASICAVVQSTEYPRSERLK